MPTLKLLLVRHAIAEEKEDFALTGKDDRLRPLTAEGRKKMKQNARGLRELVPDIDLLATSPLTRAAQTAAILDSVYGGLREVEIAELEPDAEPDAFLRWLRRQKAGTVAAVGHEPGMSLLLARLLTGADRKLFAFRKGGACLLELPGGRRTPSGTGGTAGMAGTGTLLWALTPSQLRGLAE